MYSNYVNTQVASLVICQKNIILVVMPRNKLQLVMRIDLLYLILYLKYRTHDCTLKCKFNFFKFCFIHDKEIFFMCIYFIIPSSLNGLHLLFSQQHIKCKEIAHNTIYINNLHLLNSFPIIVWNAILCYQQRIIYTTGVHEIWYK